MQRWARDCLHLRWTMEQHIPEVEVQVKQCQLYPRQSQQQQVPVVELRQAFLAETPRGG
ncbi:unnamed protein product [Nyctereutes procyonoides]|uniref:(raccoon dog) hypothetical protein n=1 Tax=Nyctereutes procyonoides TaxID=34880 RepID=A0A811Z7P3_NYCPR|nr:unnamed protein product [Nyctereutes procyonoides]